MNSPFGSLCISVILSLVVAEVFHLTNIKQPPSWESNNTPDQDITASVEHEDSLQCSLEPATEPCPKSHESSPHPYTLFL
jgi:hypothetical protein